MSDLSFNIVPEDYTLQHPRTSNTIPSLIKWTGSKRSQAKAIAQLVPPYKRYIEPFVGGGGLLYLLAHPGAIANDIYTPLADLWRLVRDEPQSLISAYATEWERLNEELSSVDVASMTRGNGIPRVFYEVRDRFNKAPNAVDLNFLMRTCVNGIVRFNHQGDFNNSFHLSRRGMIPARFEKAVKDWNPILQGVHLSNDDYKTILHQATEGDFVYLDPPYAGTKQRYSSLLEPDELFDELEKLNSRGVLWALSFDGKRGDSDMTHNVPAKLFKRHAYLQSGNSAVKKVLSGPIEKVEEALYLNY